MVSNLKSLRQFLLPHEAERDAGFAVEVQRLSLRALRVIAWCMIAVPSFAFFVHVIEGADPNERGAQAQVSALLAVCGAAALGLGRTGFGRRHARMLALLLAWLGAAILTLAEVLTSSRHADLERDAPINILATLMVVVAVLPCTPWQNFLFGLTQALAYFGFAHWAVQGGRLDGPLHESQYVAMPVLVATGTAMAGVTYRRVHQTWLSHQEALRAEARAILAEAGASMGRLAAAVSHEINTPLGALSSAAQTLGTAVSRLRPDASESERERVGKVIQSSAASVQEGATRLQAIVSRMQRFTNLDRAEVLPVDVNQVVMDVVALAEAQPGRGRVKLRLTDLPPLLGNAQLLSAAVSAVVEESIEASPAGREPVEVTTAARNGYISVSVLAPGREAPAGGMETLFDPGFRVAGSRVTTGNWNLFGARQMVGQFGGTVEVRPGGEGGFMIEMLLEGRSPTQNT